MIATDLFLPKLHCGVFATLQRWWNADAIYVTFFILHIFWLCISNVNRIPTVTSNNDKLNSNIRGLVHLVERLDVSISVTEQSFRSIQSARDDLKIIITSLPHEMERLEEFFEEVPVLDLFFLENPEVSTTPASEWGKEGSEELERRRRKDVELKKMAGLDVIYHPIAEPTMVSDVIVDLVMTLHCDQTISGDVMIFLSSVQVSCVTAFCLRISLDWGHRVLPQ